ncbi:MULTISPECIES: DUF6480 family protein [unclassified Streptomyces]|uniref:DUF6480 family protein n=1 Tax=unclassified Streptomyces TaxID=2593676 RepID=UPI00037AFA49|nr:MULTISPECIES: DUF6480 family protein [unclassified Streptomyces]MYX33420.1 hypothetical protein [Streptomyces sp. SID8377]
MSTPPHAGNRSAPHSGIEHKVPPTETPPAESSTTEGISVPERPELHNAWGFAPLVLILGVVAIFLAGVIAMIVALSS